MPRNSYKKRTFYVVQFLELPFEGIDDYVCVPYTWLIVSRAKDPKAAVAYPKDEDPSDTRDRVKRKERCNDEWRFYVAAVKYESDTYSDAENWINKHIATRNDYGPLVEEESKIIDTQPRFTLNKNSRKPLPRISIKRPALSELKKELERKRLKLDEASQSSPEPGCSNREQSIIIQDHQSMKCVYTQETAAASKGESSLSQCTDQNLQDSLPTQEEQQLNMQNSTHSPNPLYQTAELSQQRQTQLNQQNLQRQPERPKRPNIRIGIAIEPNNKGKKPTLQEAATKTPPLILTKNLNSIRQAPSTTHNNSLVNEQQTHVCQSKGGLANENHLKFIDKAFQTEECTVEETLSPYHAVSSDFDTVTDHEVISDHEVPTVEAPTETRNTVHSTGIASERSCAERLTAAQNLPNHQTHPRVILEQQMLDNFAILFTQMRSTLRYTFDMYNNLQSSMLEIAETYQNLLHKIERFNEVGNSASNASSLNNLTPVVPQAPEQNHTEIPARASSSNENQHCNDVADRAPKKNNILRLVLPPNYDSHDTRWTLKYRRNMPGLVELTPQSGIYVSYGELEYCKRVSKDCKSLARRLLLEIFNRNALSVCLSMSEKVQAPHKVGSNVRPELDKHACSVLLNVVLEYGLQCGWNTDLQPILSTLHSKIQEIRYNYDVMV